MDEKQLADEMEYARRVEEGEMTIEEQIKLVIGNIGHELGERVGIMYVQKALIGPELASTQGFKPEDVACVVLFKDAALLQQVYSVRQVYQSKEV